ncbi:MAG: T9SS type A sorting domain-containing protein [Bacteroidetes bacterium]|nr:T9SS type A sorting domain-containing protein [Bacteroidota bacterium]
MRKLLLLFMLIVSAKIYAQSSFLNFEAHQADSGGIAAWCLSGHETTFLQGTYADSSGQNCLQGNTYAYYNIGSSDKLLWGFDSLGNYIDYYGVRLTGSTGFPNFTNALQVRNIPFNKVKIYFDKITLGNDQEGNDWFASRGTESRFYRDQHNAHYYIAVDGHYFASGKMPTTQMMIDYVNSGNCKDDIIKAKSIYTNVDSGFMYNDTLGRALCIAFLADVGNRGIAFDFATLTTAIHNQYKVIGWNRNQDCNPFYNPALYPIMDNIAWGAVYECNNGKILLSDYPLDNSLDSIAFPANNQAQCNFSAQNTQCTNSGNWVHVRDNDDRVASFLDDQNLGWVNVSYQSSPRNPANFENPNIANNREYLGRKFYIASQTNPVAPVRVRLYFLRRELNYLIGHNGNQVTDPRYLSDLAVTRVCGNQGCGILLAEDYGQFIPVIESGTFGDGYYVDILTNTFGQFIIHNGNTGIFPPAPAPIGGLLSCSIGNRTALGANNGFTTVWTSTNPAVATVALMGALVNRANVTSVSNGTTNIYYERISFPNSTACKVSSLPVTYTVDKVTVPAIAGAAGVCIGATVQLSNVMPAGGWSSIAGRAVVNANGLVTGQVAGNATIRYTITNANGCTGFADKNVTVFAQPPVPTIKYAPGTSSPQAVGAGLNLCLNRTFDVSGSPAGGIFMSSNPALLSAIPNIGLNNNTYTLRTLGLGNVNITYRYTLINGCSNSRVINATIVNCPLFKGIKASDAMGNTPHYVIYPNPARNIVNIKIDYLDGSGNIVITDILGKPVKQQTLSLGTNSIDVSGLSKGVYLASIITEQGKQTEKLIIQ